jgi:diacylglycerol kinase family enzyme
MPPRRVVAVVNSGAGSVGGAGGPSAVEDAFRRHGSPAEVLLVPGSRAGPAARRAVEEGADVVVAGGGDGTVSAVAAQVAGTGRAFGVLALGTLNHFAKDCGLPLSLDEAVEAVLREDPVACDVGRCNGVAFVNNATLGLYADQVNVRRRWRALGKWPGAVLASIVVLRRFSSQRLAIESDGERVDVVSPLVVVSNNPYALAPGRPTSRSRIDSGTLGRYVVSRVGRWGLVVTAVKSLVMSLEGDSAFDAGEARRVVVRSRRRSVRVALDGEIVKMRPPVSMESEPGALPVLGARFQADEREGASATREAG